MIFATQFNCLILLNNISIMLTTVKGIIQKHKIKLVEKVDIPEGTKLLITILSPEEDEQFWQNASISSLTKVWNNSEDNIYAELLKK